MGSGPVSVRLHSQLQRRSAVIWVWIWSDEICELGFGAAAVTLPPLAVRMESGSEPEPEPEVVSTATASTDPPSERETKCGTPAARLPDVFAVARAGDSAKMAMLLAAHPAAARATDSHQWTALHYAASDGRKGVAALLLGAGAMVECRNVDGWTPLHFAARAGKAALVTLLLDAGASKTTKSGDGRTATEIAWAKNKYTVAELIDAHALGGATGAGSSGGHRGAGAAAGDDHAVAREAVGQIRAELVKIYAAACPEKAGEVDGILAKFHGREAELLEKVKAKYS